MTQDNERKGTFDADNLYREEVFTDRTVGNLRRLTPVKSDGTLDENRSTIFVGQTQVMTAMGAMPLTFELDAEDMEGAIAAYTEGAKTAFEETMKEMEKMRREQASSIVVPGQAGGAPSTPGGNKFQL